MLACVQVSVRKGCTEQVRPAAIGAMGIEVSYNSFKRCLSGEVSPAMHREG